MITNKIYIILINYNNWKDTIECLESVLRNSYQNYQVIVIDNNSSNDSIDKIKGWAEGILQLNANQVNSIPGNLLYPLVIKPINYVFYHENELLNTNAAVIEKANKCKLILIKANENRGFSAGNNIGIKYALLNDDFDSIILLNNDTIVDIESISRIINARNKYGDEAIYGGRIFYYDRPDILWYDGGYFNKWIGRATNKKFGKKSNYLKEVEKVSFITFCYVLIPKLVIRKVGLLDENYFMYNEDLDYSFIVRKKGFQLLHVNNSIIWHKIGASHNGPKSDFEAYWIMRSKIYFIKKQLPTIKKITSIIFIIITGLIRTPYFFITNKSIIENQLKGFIDGFK